MYVIKNSFQIVIQVLGNTTKINNLKCFNTDTIKLYDLF